MAESRRRPEADAEVISLDDHRDDHGPDDRESDRRPGSERMRRVPPRVRPAQDGDQDQQAEPERPDVDHDQQADTAELARLLTELSGAAQRLIGGLGKLPIERLRGLLDDPVREGLALAEELGVDFSGSVEEMTEFVRSRISGDYAIDEFGFDPEFTEAVVLPALRQLARRWFRVEVTGVENIPTDGAALLVSNHAGTLPMDAMILQSVIFDEVDRHTRCLGADLVFATPYAGELARKMGVTLACQEDAERLLDRGELVSVFPEGFKGLGKLYSERYKLQRFGRGGFVSAAVRAQVPIVPISIVGSEETYPQIAQLPTLARILGVPYLPVTPMFPLLGVLGLIPLPSKWIIKIGEQIATDELPAGAADDPMVVFNVTDQVRETIQHTLYELLMQRRGIFIG
jgi:1-acyl-sn-glycerol-3-phosphate acyltransferase